MKFTEKVGPCFVFAHKEKAEAGTLSASDRIIQSSSSLFSGNTSDSGVVDTKDLQ